MSLRTIYIIGGFLFFYLLIPHLAYWGGDHPDLPSLGQYGDFTGGISSPLLSVLNILALLYVTYVVSESDEKRAKNEQHLEDTRNRANIDTQKLMAINQLRYEATREIAMTLDTLRTDFYSTDPSFETIKHLHQSFDFFVSNNIYLFQDLFSNEFVSSTINPLKKLINDLAVEVGTSHAIGKVGPRPEQLSRLMNDYWNSKNVFVDKLNKFVIQEMSPKS